MWPHDATVQWFKLCFEYFGLYYSRSRECRVWGNRCVFDVGNRMLINLSLSTSFKRIPIHYSVAELQQGALKIFKEPSFCETYGSFIIATVKLSADSRNVNAIGRVSYCTWLFQVKKAFHLF